MMTRKLVAAAATLALLAACSKSPDSADSAAGTAADTDEHAEHTPATPAIARTRAPAGATVFIDSPKEGDLVANPVRVVFGVTGVTVTPVDQPVENGGHHHLLIDTSLASAGVAIPTDAKHLHFGKGETETTVELSPGAHTLQLVLGDQRHVPFDPVVASQKVNIVVR